MSKIKAFTLAEVLIVLVLIGVLTAILLPVAFQAAPDENVVKFKKAHSTLITVIRELVTSDEYYKDGDLGTRANGNLVDRTHDGDYVYFCNTFADLLTTKSVQCPESGASTGGSTVGVLGSSVVDVATIKNTLDDTCANTSIQSAMAGQIVTPDNVVYYETDPERTFGSNSGGSTCSWTDCTDRAFAAPNSTPYYTDSRGFDINYKIFCIDIDGTNNGEAPFGYGIRADGKILTGARADEWMKKSVQKND